MSLLKALPKFYLFYAKISNWAQGQRLYLNCVQKMKTKPYVSNMRKHINNLEGSLLLILGQRSTFLKPKAAKNLAQ